MVLFDARACYGTMFFVFGVTWAGGRWDTAWALHFESTNLALSARFEGVKTNWLNWLNQRGFTGLAGLIKLVRLAQLALSNRLDWLHLP